MRAARGSVFEVTPVSVRGEACVMKRVAADVADAPAARAALVREASFLALASHPALPRILEVGSDEDGPFIVEDAMAGLTLAELSSAWEDRVPLHLALHVATEAARALAEIHALSDAEGPLALVHGDPSFDNLLVSPTGHVAFVDFGNASYRKSPPRDLLQSGTPPYAAPELIAGSGAPTESTDAYALAAVSIRLLTGAPLRPEPEEAARLVRLVEGGIDLGPLERAPLDPSIVDALVGLVAVDPRARRGSLADLVRALDRGRR